MTTRPVQARLHVLLSRDGGTGVVIRRGPSKRVCTIGWNRRDDTFVIGQWLQGRIYERRCDLSPDGTYMIYFAMNGRWSSEVKGAWTAISRAPYLKAVSLWPKGDCWNGGGLFLSSERYWLNDGYGHGLLHETDVVERDREYSPAAPLRNNECLGVYYPRLLRDGWKFIGSRQERNTSRVDVFEKDVNDTWILRKLARATVDHPDGKGVYYDEHELVKRQTDQALAFAGWEWADVDANRLVWTEGGTLYASELSAEGPAGIQALHDFNSYTYTRIRAPY